MGVLVVFVIHKLALVLLVAMDEDFTVPELLVIVAVLISAVASPGALAN